MKRSLKVALIIVIFMSIICLLQNVSSAWEFKKSEVESWVTTANGKDGGLVNSTQNIMGKAINVIRIVGTGIAIIMLTYVAIKYMSAAPSEKAEFKKSAMALIVGAIVLFAATNILSIIANFASKNITETTNPVQGTIQVEE